MNISSTSSFHLLTDINRKSTLLVCYKNESPRNYAKYENRVLRIYRNLENRSCLLIIIPWILLS